MAANRNQHPPRRKPTSRNRTWVPAKYRDEVQELLKPPPDPWAEPPPFRWEQGARVPAQAYPHAEGDLWSYWEWILQGEHFHEFPDLPPRERRRSLARAKPFWQLLQTCEILRQLCAERPSRALHVVIAFLYDGICRRRMNEGLQAQNTPPRVSNKALRARSMRYWSWVGKHIGEMITMVDPIPQDVLPPKDRARTQEILQAASGRAAKLSVRMSFVQFTPDGKEEKVLCEIPQEWAEAGRPSGKRDSLNLDVAILVNLMRKATRGRHHSRIAVELLKHFLPEEFPASFDEKNLKGRIKQFHRRTTDASQRIERGKSEFLNYTIGRLFPPPHFLPTDPH